MEDLLKQLSLEHLEGETRDLAETIGIDAFRRLVFVYGGTGRLYIPVASNICAPVRNRHIYEDHEKGGLTVPQLALKYSLTDAYIRRIIKERKKYEK